MQTAEPITFTQLGVAGILILMVLDKVFIFIYKMRDNKNG